MRFDIFIDQTLDDGLKTVMPKHSSNTSGGSSHGGRQIPLFTLDMNIPWWKLIYDTLINTSTIQQISQNQSQSAAYSTDTNNNICSSKHWSRDDLKFMYTKAGVAQLVCMCTLL